MLARINVEQFIQLLNKPGPILAACSSTDDITSPDQELEHLVDDALLVDDDRLAEQRVPLPPYPRNPGSNTFGQVNIGDLSHIQFSNRY